MATDRPAGFSIAGQLEHAEAGGRSATAWQPYLDFTRDVQNKLLCSGTEAGWKERQCQWLFVYKDLPSESWSWASSAIQQLSLWGIVQGKDPSQYLFDPAAPVTRAEFAKMVMLLRAKRESVCVDAVPKAKEIFESGTASCTVDGLTDVDGHWACGYIKEAHAQSIIHGFSGEADATGAAPFKPDDPIKRRQLTKLITAGLDLCPDDQELTENYSTEIAQFSDPGLAAFCADPDDSEHWYCKPLVCASLKNVIRGRDRSGGYFFDGQETATRAEAVLALYRAFDASTLDSSEGPCASGLEENHHD